ncbi:MAG: DUF4845 domain-containing protein [Thiolinea sp.]
MIFAFVTLVKLAPVYMEFYAVKSMVEDIVLDPAISANSTQSLRGKIADYLNVNGLYTIEPGYFSVVTLPEKKNVKALQVEYEVRKPWLANIDFLMTFKHVAELRR